MTGQFDRAIAEGKRAVELDPLSLVINANLGTAYFNARRYGEAITQLRKTIEMDPRFDFAHRALGEALQVSGQLNEAIAEYRKAVELSDNPSSLAHLGQAYARAGQREEAQKILAQLSEEAKSRYVRPYSFAYIYLALGLLVHQKRCCQSCRRLGSNSQARGMRRGDMPPARRYRTRHRSHQPGETVESFAPACHH